MCQMCPVISVETALCPVLAPQPQLPFGGEGGALGKPRRKSRGISWHGRPCTLPTGLVSAEQPGVTAETRFLREDGAETKAE